MIQAKLDRLAEIHNELSRRLQAYSEEKEKLFRDAKENGTDPDTLLCRYKKLIDRYMEYDSDRKSVSDVLDYYLTDRFAELACADTEEGLAEYVDELIEKYSRKEPRS